MPQILVPRALCGRLADLLSHHTGLGEPKGRANYSNRGWREKIFENMFFEAERRGKLFQMKVLDAAIDSDKFSSKSELSSRFFGRLKFSALFE